MKSTTAAALAALSLSACQPTPSSQPAAAPAPMPASPAPAAGACTPGLLAELKGLTLQAAQARLDAAQVPHRVVRDGKQEFPVTLDHRPDRVSLELDDGKVVAASCG